MPRNAGLFALLIFVLAWTAAPAGAAQRYASPSSSTTSGSCAVSAPCSLASAIGGAASGDEVVVQPGDYVVKSSISPTVSLDIHGVAGQPRPRLVGASNLGAATLSVKLGGTLRHLSVESTSTSQSALVLQGTTAEDLVIAGAGGEAAKLVGAPTTTVLRDSIAHTTGTASDVSALKIADGSASSPGDVALVNVTVDATAGQAIGIRCLTATGQTTIANSIVRGGSYDVDASNAGVHCTATSSDFRAISSPGLTSGAGNISADPLYANAAGGNFRPLAGSPVVDAGAPNARLGTLDPDGRARTLGAAPDMGAYELDSGNPPSASSPSDFPAPPAAALQPETTSSTTSSTATPSDPAPAGDPAPAADPAPALSPAIPGPTLGHTVVLAPATGTVLVRRPGAARDVPLEAGAAMPVGTVIDTTKGTVELHSAIDAKGTTQTGRFWGGRFVVEQPKGLNGVTQLRLTGGSFAGCPKTGTVARAAAVRKPPRRLWGSDHHGRFQTRGRGSVATVRGTRWLTEDRCEGTLTRVTQGAVAVRDLRAKRTVLVRAGHSYLARVERG